MIAADPNGAVLFVGGSAGISTFTVNANDGSLTPIATVTTGSIPSQIATDGLGKYVYALTGSTITAFCVHVERSTDAGNEQSIPD